MLFLPIRTDRRQRHKPWVNYALIAVNAVIFILTRPQFAGDASIQWVEAYMLKPYAPELYQFITYQFLHGDIWHLLGNMTFLYVFGNVLEDKLGKVSYLAFYLGGGVMAGLAHAATTVNPVLGASGSVAAVTGAFLALLPKTDVTIFYWFYFYVGTFDVSGMVLVIYQIILNVVMFGLGGEGVSYIAHLGGYGFGFAIGMGLLYTRLMPREPFDLLSLLEHRRRRSQFQSLTKSGYQPWQHQDTASKTPRRGGKGSATKPNAPLSEQQQKILEYRHDITTALNAHDPGLAAMRYTDLLELDDKQVLNQDAQLEVANYFMQQQRYTAAANTYERFLDVYTSYTQRVEIELILGLIYARYLKNPERAKQLLTAALPKLHDDEKQKLTQKMLDQLGGE